MAKSKKQYSDEVVKEASVAPGPPRLRQRFDDEVSAKVAEKFGLKNPMSRPSLDKIIVNVNMGRFLDGGKLPSNVREAVVGTLTTITGQKPVVVKAKQSVSNFKVREGMETSAYVTMRRERMWYFLDRLINLATPRIRDFRGLRPEAFDGGGSYAFGLTEQGAFPEIDMANTSVTHGMNINIVFRNSDPEKSRFVLEELGMPFRRDDEGAKRA